MWLPIAEEVKTWLNSKVGGWINDEPGWFKNAGVRAMIPDHFVDDKEILKKLKEMKVGEEEEEVV